MTKHVVSIDLDGKEFSLETGRMAKFADGAVMVKCGESMVLCTVVASRDEQPEKDFLPLQVEYREKTASAGKFPGGFLKREGRPSDHEVLTSRLIDRPIRPMIPKHWRFETQILCTVFSADPAVSPDTLGALGASAALMISDVPFAGPIAEVTVGRIDGEFVLNPSFEELKNSDIDITIAGTDTSIAMVEGESDEISEEDFLAAMLFGHEKLKELIKLQLQLAELVNKEKREATDYSTPEIINDFVVEFAEKEITDFIHTDSAKKERSAFRRDLKERLREAALEKFEENEDLEEKDILKYTGEAFGDLEKHLMREMILTESRRLDGRALDEIRPIVCETGILPRAHGSALFTRGETQSLTTVTLGTKRDEQMIDGLLPTYTNNFMLHYNFPAFCTGEIKRLGLSRREVGHGNLALRALKKLLPSHEEFPYTLRVVSDILESNGSSSMATVCAGCLALYDAGVPMPKHVSGIAMGLIKEGDRYSILSDILGDEDHLGDMDFKVTGTVDGITACQMDIKIEGLPIDIMTEALEQARLGRLHIINILKETIENPREDLSNYAPRYTSLTVPRELIGAIIGPGGEMIRHISRETETEINIDDDGIVMIAATNGEASRKAEEMIKEVIKQPEAGEVYNARIKEIREGLGAILEFMPGKTGLLHISQIAHERVEDVGKYLKEGDMVEIKLLEITRDGKFRLSRKAMLERPEGMPEEEERRPSRDRNAGGYNRGGGGRRYDDRRGGGGDRRGGDRRPGGGDRRDDRRPGSDRPR